MMNYFIMIHNELTRHPIHIIAKYICFAIYFASGHLIDQRRRERALQ